MPVALPLTTRFTLDAALTPEQRGFLAEWVRRRASRRRHGETVA